MDEDRFGVDLASRALAALGEQCQDYDQMTGTIRVEKFLAEKALPAQIFANGGCAPTSSETSPSVPIVNPADAVVLKGRWSSYSK